MSAPTTHEIVLDVDGSARMIYADALAPLAEALGETTTRRASEVEPVRGGWSADMGRVGGPVLGPYVKRADALAAEVEWLLAHDVPLPL